MEDRTTNTTVRTCSPLLCWRYGALAAVLAAAVVGVVVVGLRTLLPGWNPTWVVVGILASTGGLLLVPGRLRLGDNAVEYRWLLFSVRVPFSETLEVEASSGIYVDGIVIATSRGRSVYVPVQHVFARQEGAGKRNELLQSIRETWASRSLGRGPYRRAASLPSVQASRKRIKE